MPAIVQRSSSADVHMINAKRAEIGAAGRWFCWGRLLLLGSTSPAWLATTVCAGVR